MPKKTKPSKPIPSALTVASASQFPVHTAPKTHKFIVDGQWVPDPNVPERAADGYGDGNSVIEVRG